MAEPSRLSIYLLKLHAKVGDDPNIIRRHNGELLNKLHKWRPHAIHDNITKRFTMKEQ